ncbi:MAG: LysR family transcriptional regulator [Pseudomonadales bacterium]|nr:LysR family transcriptional regulator [Pseudomonadales bacterium]
MNRIKLLPALLVFSEVANKGSFTEAAKELGLSKSTVSQQISRLEDDLGFQLLTRNTRGLSVTAVGKKLLRRCTLLQDQVDLAYQELLSAEQEPSGPFAVTLPYSLERDVVIPAMSQLCREFPALEPRLLVTDEKMDLVKNELDVAIFAGQLQDSNYRALPIGTVKDIFCCSPKYRQTFGAPESVEDLHRHRWIEIAWQKSPLIYFKEGKAQKNQIELRPFAKVNTQLSAIEMALEDMGIILFSDVVPRPLIQAGKLCQIASDNHGPTWPIHLIHPFQGEKPIHISRFHQLVSHYFSTQQVKG